MHTITAQKRTLLSWLMALVALSMLITACQPAATPTAAPAQATNPPAEAQPTPQPTVAPAQAATSVSGGQSGETCTPTGTIKRGGELRFARPEEPQTWDPTVPGDNGSIWAMVQVFDTLVRPDATGVGLEPGLAKSWEISPDGKEYTFNLRDAKFSDGSPVTAEDVVFSLTNAKTSGAYGFIYGPMDKVEKVDDKTVKVTLTAPYAPFLSVASLFTGGIVSKAAYEKDKDAFSKAPVASGPFMVQEYTRGDKFVLVPNPNYWELGVDCQPLPYLNKVTVKYIPENTSRLLGFQNGDFDVMQGVPAQQADTVKAMPDTTLHVAPIFALSYIYLNHAKPPLDKKEFRLALNYAIDRQTIIEKIGFGYGELANSFMPKMRYWSKDVTPIPYDPEKAKELLTQAGYSGETMTLLIAAGDSAAKQEATMIQQWWQAVGIKTEIQELDLGTVWDAMGKGDYMGFLGGITSDINDDDELATLELDSSAEGSNAFYSFLKDSELNDLLSKARQTSDETERATLYAQIQEKAYNDGYSVPISFGPALYGYHNYVMNWKTTALGFWWLRNVWLDK